MSKAKGKLEEVRQLDLAMRPLLRARAVSALNDPGGGYGCTIRLKQADRLAVVVQRIKDALAEARKELAEQGQAGYWLGVIAQEALDEGEGREANRFIFKMGERAGQQMKKVERLQAVYDAAETVVGNALSIESALLAKSMNGSAQRIRDLAKEVRKAEMDILI